MGNQQRRDLEGIVTLARNAKIGDGYLWRHPECINSKVIYMSTDKGLLEAKQKICPSIFRSGVRVCRKKNTGTNISKKNKTLYRLTSIVHPIFNEYHKKSKIEVFQEFTLFDFALWYLDDGCCTKRSEYKEKAYYRFIICIGEVATNNENIFIKKVKSIFSSIKTRGNTVGSIKKNNSKATENNKSWSIPIPIGKKIAKTATDFYFMQKRIPYVQRSETNPKGSRDLGLNKISKQQPGLINPEDIVRTCVKTQES